MLVATRLHLIHWNKHTLFLNAGKTVQAHFFILFNRFETISSHTEQAVRLWTWCLSLTITQVPSSSVTTHQSDYAIVVMILALKKTVALRVVHVFVFYFLFFPPSVIGADAGNGIRVFIPDIGMFVAGLVIWLLCRSLVQKRPPEDMAQYNADFDAEEQVSLFSSFPISSSSAFALRLLFTRFPCTVSYLTVSHGIAYGMMLT